MRPPDLILDYNHIDLINKEQRRQMEMHAWIVSEKARKDIGEQAKEEWVEKYAPGFRRWAESLVYTCVSCRKNCSCNKEGMCQNPFDEDRIKFIEKK